MLGFLPLGEVALGCSYPTLRGHAYKHGEPVPVKEFELGGVACQVVVLKDLPGRVGKG